MTPRLEDFIRDPSAIEELTRPRNRLIMVMGGSDTGKTTLVECAADFLSRHARLGIVDLDMGQSHIGPPTTVAWGKIEEGFGGWSKIATEDFYFTGTTTPFGSLLPAVVGATLITERALSCCEKVLVDTSGLIADPAGRILKQSKVDILRPDAVLALERSAELGHILDAFRFHTHPRVFRLRAPDVVKSKAVTRRSLYRFKKMEGYLSGSRLLEVPLDTVGVRPIRELSRLNFANLKNRVISFRDERNRDIALGVIERTRSGENKLLIRTPLNAGTRFSTIIIGKARFDREHSVLTDRE